MYLNSPGIWAFDTRDLMRAASCRHCTTVSALRSLKVEPAMAVLQPYIDAIAEKRAAGEDKTLAQKYGDIFEATLQSELLGAMADGSVRQPEIAEDAGLPERFEATIALMREGAIVIYQGGLIHSNGVSEFRGKPDFLVRDDHELRFVEGRLTAVPVGLEPGRAGLKYTAWDAKAATSVKPAYALQVGIYISALEAVGFKADSASHGVILGSRRLEPFHEAEVVPAMELARTALENQIASISSYVAAGGAESLIDQFSWQCDTKKACDICEYPDLCDDNRHNTDDLVLVHSIRGNQRQALIASGITTVAELGAATNSAKPETMDPKVWGRLQRQARVQAEAKAAGRPLAELVEDPQLQYLPPASPGDIFFDMEGFPYYTNSDGLEYLFGNYTRDGEFIDFWAHDRIGEKKAFEDFVTWAVRRLEEHPDAHIYHYAPYEQTALRKLANRHATMEKEVDWLSTNHKLVDLAAMVKNSLVVGEESYSIKKLEPHYGFKREADVKKAGDSLDGYDAWLTISATEMDSTQPLSVRKAAEVEAAALLNRLREYNKEDVISTLALYEWLAGMDGACTRFGTEPAEDETGTAENSQTKSQRALEDLLERTRELFEPLNGWSEGESESTDSNARAWAALAHSILYYHREKVMYWTDINIRIAKEDAELVGDRKAALLTHVIETDCQQITDRDGSVKVLRHFTAVFDPDDIYQPRSGDGVMLRFQIDGNRQARCFGSAIEVGRGVVEFSGKFALADARAIPNALFAHTLIPEDTKVAALNELARKVTADWRNPFYEAPEGWPALDLLLRRPPRLQGLNGLPAADSTDYLPAIIEAVDHLNHSVLAIQGPPGTGKTYLASHTIAHLISQGKRVGVVTTSHSASENLLHAAIKAGVPSENVVKPRKSGTNDPKPWATPAPGRIPAAVEKMTGGALIGGTAWTFSNDAVASIGLDYVFIDEAAQFSMVDALAVSRATKNLILLGDPQQLSQVVQAIHPGGVENSALGHYMGEHAILPATHGYFVEVTRRLHPAINSAVSWLSYEGKLRSHPNTEAHVVEGVAPGLVLHEVDHSNNATRSAEEAAVVMNLVEMHLANLSQEDILVISPYNAQVDALRKELDAAGFPDIEVGTVDRFQGREAAVVIYSFAASSAEDAPRGLEFVLDQNRLNVGISRAQSVCHLVYSPKLLTANFQTLGQLKAVSRLAGLRGHARTSL